MTSTSENPEERSGTAKTSIWQTPWMNTLGRFLALVVVFVFFAIMVEDGRFYTPRNLENIVRQSAVYATAALGMTMIIIAGGIDLSIGSVIALTVVMVAWVLNLPYHEVAADGSTQAGKLIEHYPTLLPIAALVAAVLVATIAGMANGVLIVGLRLVPFIVTLGTMGIFRGIAKGISGEKDIYPPDTWLNSIMDPTLTSNDPSRSWMLLPPGIWMLIVASVLAALLLRYTRLGRHIFAIGSSEDTARLCGVPVERTKIIVYIAGRVVRRFGGNHAVFVHQWHRPADHRDRL